MNGNKSYITLCNEFWRIYHELSEELSPGASVLYLCLLDKFNKGGRGNHWPEEVTLSDYELARLTKLRRHSLPLLKKELTSCGIIAAESTGKGCRGATKYALLSPPFSLSERPEKKNRSDMTHSKAENRSDTTHSKAAIGQIRPNHSLYSLKDSISNNKTSTATETSRARESEVEEVAVVEVVAEAPAKEERAEERKNPAPSLEIPSHEAPVSVLNIQESQSPQLPFAPPPNPTDERLRRELGNFLQEYFSESRRATVEQAAMNLHVDIGEYQRLAYGIVEEWMACRNTGDDGYDGHVDFQKAARHLLNHARKKIYSLQKEQKAASNGRRTQEQARNEIMQFCLDKTQEAIFEERQRLNFNNYGTNLTNPPHPFP